MNRIENARRIKPVELVMVLDDLSGLPRFALPSAYSYRGFRRGDEELWARIETSAGEFASTEEAIQLFRREFGEHQPELRDRCIFVESENGEPVGTAMELLSFRRDRAYLTTHSKSLVAIKIYLDFGFLPYIREDLEQEEWVDIVKQLGIADPDICSSFRRIDW